MDGGHKSNEGAVVSDAGGTTAADGASEPFLLESIVERPVSGDYLVRWNRETTEPSVAIVAALSAVTGIDVTAVEPPLYSVIDPTSLDMLLDTSTAGPLSIEFAWLGYDFTVTNADTISISNRDHRSPVT